MANTYYDSQLTAAEIEAVLEAIKGILVPANNGKVLAISDGKFEARSVQWGGGEAVVQPLSVTQNGTYNPPSGVDGYAPVTVNVPGGGGGIVRVDHNIYTYSLTVVASGAMSAGFEFTVSKSLVISKIRVYAAENIVSAHIMDGNEYLASIVDESVTVGQWNELVLQNNVTLVPEKTYTVWYSHKNTHPYARPGVVAPYIPFITYLNSVYATAADTVPDRTEYGTMMGADLFLYGIVADE